MLGEIINHIWQSTVFGFVAALMTLAFLRNGAHVRYWLWLVASLKFLLPFALLMGLGSRLGWAPVTRTIAASSDLTLTMVQISQPFSAALPVAPTPRGGRDWTAIVIVGLWACGFAAVTLVRVWGWLAIRAAIRSSKPVSIPSTVAVRSVPGLLEPGVVGLFRPVLLVPAGIVERLKPLQLEAVFAHELCHVRRRDNLSAAIHMLVEAIFWFHPLVWWIGARLIEERERACDEAVLNLGFEPRVYVEGILGVCKSYLKPPLICVSGVTGSNLKKRIQAILTGPVTRDLTFANKLALAVAGTAALAGPVTFGVITAPALRAESPGAAALKFQEASIQRCEAFRKSDYLNLPPETFDSGCTTLERLIQQAYSLFANGRMNPGSFLRVTGGPGWTASDLYRIHAKASGPQSRSTENGPMLEALLEDRFKLKSHRESRDVPVYTVTVLQGGLQLQPFRGACTPRDFDKPPSAADCATARGYGSGFEMKAATIADLCAGLSVLLNRPVIDRTGIAGRFNMRLDFSAEKRASLNRPRSLVALSDPTTPAPPPLLFDSAKAAMKKLGLDLEAAQGPIEFVVVDHVQRPSEDRE